jgi:endonuclease YncB( thermonuclease family)
MRTFYAVLFSMLAGVAVAAEPAVLKGKVVAVSDGDTLRVLDASGTQHVVRLRGIDAPETRQAFGTKARERLAKLTMGKAATVLVHDRDRFGRSVGVVEVAGENVNERLVADGMAWHYARFDKSPALAAAQREAQAAKRGLWADDYPVPPWEWRATEKDRKAVPAGR